MTRKNLILNILSIAFVIGCIIMLALLAGCAGGGEHHHDLPTGGQTGPAKQDGVSGWSTLLNILLGVGTTVLGVGTGYPMAKAIQRRFLPGLSAPIEPERKTDAPS